MPRAAKEHAIQTTENRKHRKARAEPYWRSPMPGFFIGYRKSKAKSAWIARWREPDGSYREAFIGTPDDHLKADGHAVLNYAQAVKAAQRLVEGKAGSKPQRFIGDSATLNDVVGAYLEGNEASPVSNRNAAQLWASHGRDAIGGRTVAALTAADYRAWLRALATKPPRNRGTVRPFDPTDPEQARARIASANRTWTVLRAALNFGYANKTLGRDARDEWEHVKPLKEGERPPPRMLTEVEAKRLLNGCDPDFRQVVAAALLTGGRYGELIALRCADFDRDHGTIRLHQTKTGKTLIQPLAPEGWQFFEGATAGQQPDTPVLRRADGSPWRRDHQARPMRLAAQRADLRAVSFKVTRATYGKLLLLATKDIEIVARALGHSDSRITRKHYAGILPDEVSRAVANLPKLGIITLLPSVFAIHRAQQKKRATTR